MRLYAFACALVISALPAFAAQQLNLSSLDGLAARATGKTEVTLDSSMIAAASGFLSDGKTDEASAKKVLSGVKGIYVRVFEFDKPGAYSEADLKPIRDQLRGSQWKTIVSSHEKDDNVDVMMRQEDGVTTGLIVIASEPMEVTVINIVGSVSLKELSALGGQFGVPRVGSKK
jgi:Domain of unknown function (DUF4252)